MWLSRKRKTRPLNDAGFDNIAQCKPGCWKGTQFELWGYHQVQLLLDADENGPSNLQRSLYRELRTNSENIRERVERAVRTRSLAEVIAFAED